MSALALQMDVIGAQARHAAQMMALAESAVKTDALHAIAAAIAAKSDAILAINTHEVNASRDAGISAAMLDRLLLTPERIQSMAQAVRRIAAQPDPVGTVLDAWDVIQNGLRIKKIAVPLGVIGMIYESRPNVTAEAAALCLLSGNACILRCGSESIKSAQAIGAAIHEGLRDSGLPAHAVQLIPTTDREAVGIMMHMTGVIDILIPRGGASLTQRVLRESRVPTLQHLEGNCHTYIHRAADVTKAVTIVHNAKLRRTGICGATESLLIDRAVLNTHGVAIIRDLLESGCEVRGDAAMQALDARVVAAQESDWGMEYLAPVISVKTVANIDEAVAHIDRYGSHHTEAIITEDEAAATEFERRVDSAIILVNASTQFADGGEFGFGGEIGISTGRLHARGPVGAAQLVTYKYIVTTHQPEGAWRA